MAAKTTLNAKNLEALGASRLAELLIEISTGNAVAKRRLRFELAGAESPAEAAREVRKRLASIAKSRSFVDWQKRQALVVDLDGQRRAIVDQIAKADPPEGLDLMWRFMALANPVFERCDDSSGTVSGVFHEACRDLGKIAEAVKPDPEALAGQVFSALNENGYGQYDQLLDVLAVSLGQKGLGHLKTLMVDLSKAELTKPAEKDRVVIGWGSGRGRIYAEEIEERSRNSTVRMALMKIADLQGDVDAYISQQSAESRSAPRIAADIARRLLSAGRAEEALTALDAVTQSRKGWAHLEWEQTRSDVLEALGRNAEAQSFRWACFESSLAQDHLRIFMKRLPDFDDVEAEGRAMTFALGYPDMLRALSFLVTWPALKKAAQLVLNRADELDGDHYEFLVPAAEALEGKHPLAAILLRRAMIDFTLNETKATRYRHAARHLLECQSLSGPIADYGRFPRHEDYVNRLKELHGRKTSFWSLLKASLRQAGPLVLFGATEGPSLIQQDQGLAVPIGTGTPCRFTFHSSFSANRLPGPRYLRLCKAHRFSFPGYWRPIVLVTRGDGKSIGSRHGLYGISRQRAR